MEGSVIDLSKYRWEKAKDDLETAKILLRQGSVSASVNRSYYAILHAMRAVNALETFDAKSHSAVISHFSQRYLKSGIFDKGLSKLIRAAFKLRGDADYEDFFTVSEEQAQAQIEDAEKVLSAIEPYLMERWEQGEPRE